MHLLLVAGFLGSGKTTLVIRLAAALVAAGRRCAILVNEIGEIGIDNQLMRQLDLNVWELTNGCICCSLAADLVTTLQQLDRDFSPDLVIVEPSGAADPASILRALPLYRGRPLASLRTATLIDPLRLPMLRAVLTPLIESQIRAADFLLITMGDLASPAEIAAAVSAARECSPAAPIFTLQPQEPLPPDLLRCLLP